MTDDAMRWMEQRAEELRTQERKLLNIGNPEKPPSRPKPGKFTAEQVREIRALQGSIQGTELARRRGVHPSVIHQIWTRSTYQWVD